MFAINNFYSLLTCLSGALGSSVVVVIRSLRMGCLFLSCSLTLRNKGKFSISTIGRLGF